MSVTFSNLSGSESQCPGSMTGQTGERFRVRANARGLTSSAASAPARPPSTICTTTRTTSYFSARAIMQRCMEPAAVSCDGAPAVIRIAREKHERRANAGSTESPLDLNGVRDTLSSQSERGEPT